MNSPAFLQGFRALDLTTLSGQLCGRMLADLGMEVIKIEPPGGDPVRKLAPFVKLPNGSELSTPFAHLNAGKASKVLNLDKEADREVFRKLVETAQDLDVKLVAVDGESNQAAATLILDGLSLVLRD